MNNQIADTLPEIATFQFPALYHGINVRVSVAWNDDRFNIAVDDKTLAEIKFNEDMQEWKAVRGDLRDYDLLKEVGSRIEAKYLFLN